MNVFPLNIALLMCAFAHLSGECLANVDVSSALLGSFVSGRQLTTGVFQQEILYSLRDCIRECWLQSRCKTITHHKKHLTCDLGGSLAVVNDTTDQYYVTSDRNGWPHAMELAGVCKTHNCTEHERCVSLKSGKYRCIEIRCAPGLLTFKRKCYWFGRDKLVWALAQSDCVTGGGSLALLDTPKVNNFCRNEIQKRNLPLVLMAANDIDTEGDWRWGRPGPYVGYSHWAPGAPNGRTPIEDCGAMVHSGTWMDVACEVNYTYICEKPLV